MTITVIETNDLTSTSRILETDQVQSMFLHLVEGQKVPPCLMSATVVYYVVEGRGLLHVESEHAELHTGSMAVVPANTTRSISATTPMRVLAIQLL
jgi:quercetin dioxygenase-like cupin family protein